MKKRKHIAVGIILSRNGEQVFITQRAATQHQGGFWEFAGGQVELGETVEQAVVRELHEEVGITVTSMNPFTSLQHDYPDKQLAFDFFLVTDFEGQPYGKEGQPGLWVDIQALDSYAFPAANTSVLDMLKTR
ncbi:8-oxo-dGTP diphosphatase MutT [Thaumasiovibrio sp. DFM-14]|uniref:8-oxo-dGTP diphosphatase MutT n=1 Tax=Thaumasiovibrio sp. DFM-14 TaxID=3384792 RepID=UPI0039A08D38